MTETPLDDESLPKYDDIPVVVNHMWLRLAETIAASVPDVLISDGPHAAIQSAWCAEACYWQGMGEATTATILDVVARARGEQSPEERG